MPNDALTAPVAEHIGLHNLGPSTRLPKDPNHAPVCLCLSCLGQGKLPPTSRDRARATCPKCGGKGWVSR